MKTMLRNLFATLLMLVLSSQTAYSGAAHDNVDKSGLALQGYDPVSYHQERPETGKKEISLTHDGITYLFSTNENRQLFQANPGRYLPAYGGWCAWAMLDGEKVEVDPETYKIVDGQTLLFYNTFFANTLKKWNERAESETEDVLSAKARQHWAEITR